MFVTSVSRSCMMHLYLIRGSESKWHFIVISSLYFFHILLLCTLVLIHKCMTSAMNPHASPFSFYSVAKSKSSVQFNSVHFVLSSNERMLSIYSIGGKNIVGIGIYQKNVSLLIIIDNTQ